MPSIKTFSSASTKKFAFFLFVLTFFFLLFRAPCQAEDIYAQNFASDDALFWGEEETIYSATKYVKRLREAPATATVITAEQIRNMGARNILDVLKTVPGIGISITTGWKIMGIESRGLKTSDSAGVLIMMDGHKLNEPISGGTSWAFTDMMVENIKRIEVIRGPGSALYGANAFVAVINVVTKNALDIDGTQVNIGGGSFGTQHYNLMFGKEFNGFEMALALDYIETKGAHLPVESDSLGASGNTLDWRKRGDLDLKLSYGDFAFHGKYVQNRRSSYIGVGNALNDESLIKPKQYFGEITWKHSFGEDLHVLAKTYADVYDLYSFWEIFPAGGHPAFPSGYFGVPIAKDLTMGAEVQIDYSPSDNNTLTAGVLYEKIEQTDVRALGNYNPVTGTTYAGVVDISATANWNQNVTRDVKALFFQDVWKINDEFEATIGARYDDYSDFGGTFNPRAALVWKASDDATVKFLYGSAFRAPNFKELYNDNNPAQLGNPNLKPEKVQTYELSLGYWFSEKFSTNFTYFHNDIQESIDIINGVYQNQGNLVIDGLEMEVRFNYSDSNYSYANATLQDPRNADTKTELPLVSRYKGNVGFNYEMNKYLNINSNLQVVGPTLRSAGDTRASLSGYEVVDLTFIGKNFYDTMEIRASIHNLLDEKYYDPEQTGQVSGDFPREGINFMVEMSYKF